MAAGGKDLGDFDRPRKDDKRDRNHQISVAITEPKSQPVAANIAKCSRSCGTSVSGRNEGGTKDNTTMAIASSQAQMRTDFNIKNLAPGRSKGRQITLALSPPE